MTLPQSALSELLDAIKAGEGLDLVRRGVALVLQELIELELSQTIGAERYERTQERTTHRNGSRERVLSTKARRRRPAHSQAAPGLVLPIAARAPAAHRP